MHIRARVVERNDKILFVAVGAEGVRLTKNEGNRNSTPVGGTEYTSCGASRFASHSHIRGYPRSVHTP